MSILDPRAVVVPYHRGDLTVEDLMGEVAYIARKFRGRNSWRLTKVSKVISFQGEVR